MVVGVTMRSALAASAIAAAAASAKRGKKRRWTLLTPCSGQNGVDHDAVDTGTTESSRAAGRDWSGLPQPAVHLILTALLPSLTDAFSLGSVCRAWRSVFADCKRELFPAMPPLLVDRCSSPRAIGGFYSLGEGRFRRRRKQPDFWPWTYHLDKPTMDVVGVSHGYWIVRAAPPGWNSPSPVFLVDPLSPDVRIHLPQTPHGCRFCQAVMAAPPSSPDCVVVLMLHDRILYCRPGDTHWMCHSLVEGKASRTMKVVLQPAPAKVAIVGGKLYALHWNEQVVVVELLPRPCTVTVLETKSLLQQSFGNFLVESNGEILHVADVSEFKQQQQLGPAAHDASLLAGGGHHGLRPCGREHKFVVRRLDVPAQEWVTLSTLGDRCLFLNRRSTCVTWAAPARWGGGEGDCIYFFCSSSLLVYRMKDGRAEHRRLPRNFANCDWLTPSFCYR